MILSFYGSDNTIGFCVGEPSSFDKRWFNHKFKRAAACYKTIIDMAMSKVWLYGQFLPCECPGVKIFASSLMCTLDVCDQSITNDGYFYKKCLRRNALASNL